MQLGTLTNAYQDHRISYYNLLRSLSAICTVVSGGSTTIRLALIVVTESGMSVNLVVKFSVRSMLASSVIDTLKHCLERWLVKVSRVIETLV